jgi:hypothetical protein
LLELFGSLRSHLLPNIEKLLKAGINPRRLVKVNNMYYSCLRFLFPSINFHERPTSDHVSIAFEILAEFGVTPDTEEPDPDGITPFMNGSKHYLRVSSIINK